MPSTLAERVELLEKEMAELKHSLRGHPSASLPHPVPRDAWRKTVGAFKDDPFYDDMIRLGAAYRKRQPKC